MKKIKKCFKMLDSPIKNVKCLSEEKKQVYNSQYTEGNNKI